jgi:tetratricopeptide (TPR) repeat protein
MRMVPRSGPAAVLSVLLCSVYDARAQPTARFADAPPPAPAPVSAPAPVPVTPAPPAPRLASPAKRESGSWATQHARALSSRAQRYAARGDVSYAMSAYNEAIQTDPTYGAAYLGLARLREALSDYGEADRLYEMAAQLADSAAEARARRAALFKKQGRGELALREMEEAARIEPQSPARQRELAAWYVELRAWPAALAVFRQLLAELEASGASPEEIAQARVQVHALTLLAADSDPVMTGKTHPSWVRRTLSRVARRALSAPAAQSPRQLAP